MLILLFYSHEIEHALVELKQSFSNSNIHSLKELGIQRNGELVILEDITVQFIKYLLIRSL